MTHSRHGDASLEERVISVAGEGLDVVLATEHNLVTDYGPTARRLGLDSHFKTIAGTERLLKESGGNQGILQRQLQFYDQAVSIQVAELLRQRQ